MTPMEYYNRLREELIGRIAGPNDDKIRVKVQLGVCSQAVGALDVISALEEAVYHHSLERISIEKSGCMGFCSHEPIVTISSRGRVPVSYVRVTPERAGIILTEYALMERVILPWTLDGKDVTL